MLKLTLKSPFNPKNIRANYLALYSKVKSSILIIVLSVYNFLKYSTKASIKVMLIYSSSSAESRNLKLIQKSPMAHRKFSQYHVASIIYSTTIFFNLVTTLKNIQEITSKRELRLGITAKFLNVLNLSILRFSNDFFFIKDIRVTSDEWLTLR
jgi:hypothetical protein